MKKGLWVIYIIVLVLAVNFSLGAVLPTNQTYGCTAGEPCVCGHDADSTKGFGMVIIGPDYVTCDNINDGICPEDFAEEGGLVANCSSCIDYNCNATLTGKVYKQGTISPIYGAEIRSAPIRWNSTANIEKNTSTNYGGDYTFDPLTGTYYFTVSKDGFDTLVEEVNVIRGVSTTKDFYLVNGTCHEDCTNSYGRCNAACDGVEFEGGITCGFYSAQVKSLCNNRFPGTEVMLDPDVGGGKGRFIKCCGDSTVPYDKPYGQANTQTNNLKNLIKTEKIAKYNDIPVRVIVAYWRK